MVFGTACRNKGSKIHKTKPAFTASPPLENKTSNLDKTLTGKWCDRADLPIKTFSGWIIKQIKTFGQCAQISWCCLFHEFRKLKELLVTTSDLYLVLVFCETECLGKCFLFFFIKKIAVNLSEWQNSTFRSYFGVNKSVSKFPAFPLSLTW